MVKYDIEVLENDMKKVITKTNWNAVVDIVGSMGFHIGDGVYEYVNMPKLYQEMILEHMNEHPNSRLSKAYVKGDNLKLKVY